MKAILTILIIEIFFNLFFFITNGNILDAKLKAHKYAKEDYKEIFYLKNKDSIETFCIKHKEFENVKKIRQYVAGGGQETHYKVTSFID
ncbi:MAG: hypothetical protein ISR02_00230 [Flavobacteriales bacterium]|nr:hypothetical protein [Flavobacteriales bacterium]